MFDLSAKRFEKSKSTIRSVAQIIGNIICSFSQKIRNRQDYSTQKTQENYDAETELSNKAYNKLA